MIWCGQHMLYSRPQIALSHKGCDLNHKMSVSAKLCFQKRVRAAQSPGGGTANAGLCKAGTIGFTRGIALLGLNVLCPRIHQQLPLELLASAISLTDALCFSFALTATLWFKRDFPPMRTRADLKGITNAAVTFYGSTR